MKKISGKIMCDEFLMLHSWDQILSTSEIKINNEHSPTS